MGKVKKLRKNYVFHKQRWNKETIDSEKILVKNYSLKNKKEIRRIELKISKFKKIAKVLNRTEESKVSEEAKKFIARLKTNGFLSNDIESLDGVLDLRIEMLLERRLSNVVYVNKFANTASQARQLVVHRHISVNGQVIDSPAYFVNIEDENKIEYFKNSKLSNEEHPIRKPAKVEVVEEIIEEKSEEDEETVEKTEEVKAN